MTQNSFSSLVQGILIVVIVYYFQIWNQKEPSIIISLISLFNDISTFVGYLMPKPFSKKDSSGTV